MKNARRIASLLIVAILGINGCMKSEGIRPEIPSPQTASPNGIQVWIRDVRDNRKFGDDFAAWDVPSLPPVRIGALQSMRNRAVGRLRNIYNRPQGAVLLERGNTAASNVRELIVSALTSLGYEIASDGASVRPDAVILDLRLNQYWAWITSYAFSATIESRIVAVMTLATERDREVAIHAGAKRKTKSAGRHAWQETFKAAHGQFVDFVKDMFEHNPLKPVIVNEDTDIVVPGVYDSDTDSNSDADLDSESQADSESDVLTTKDATASTPDEHTSAP